MKRKIRRFQGGGYNLDYINKSLQPKQLGQLQSYPIPKLSMTMSNQQNLSNRQQSQESQSNLYGNIGRSAGMLGGAYYANQEPTYQGEDSYNKTMAGVSQAGPIGGIIGGLTAIGDSIGKPIRQRAEQQDPITGEYKNEGAAYRTNVAGSMLNPYKMLNRVTNDPNATGKDKLLAYGNMLSPGLFAVLGAKGYTKRREEGLKRDKQKADWSKSMQLSEQYRQNNPQYNYNPTFPKGGITNEKKQLLTPRSDGSMEKRVRYINDVGDINDNRLYQSPDSIGHYMTVLLRPNDDYQEAIVNELSKSYINNWNKKFGKQMGHFYNPNKPGLSVLLDSERKKLENQYNSETGIRMLGNSVYGVGQDKYPYGGFIQGNAELEDNEIFRLPNGSIEKVNGRTHAQGGEVYNLPQNTEILGKNKAPNGKSYKENGDRLIKQFNKFTKILENKPTLLAKKSANLMLTKVQNEYSNLMDMQEMEKGYYLSPEEEMEYACGGKTKYKSGGIHIKPENKGKFTAYKKRTGKTTQEALHSKDPHVRQMANFARNAAKWKHEDGGYIYPDGGVYGDPNTYLSRQRKARRILSPKEASTARGFFGTDFEDIVETRDVPKTLTPRGVTKSGMPNPIKNTYGITNTVKYNKPSYETKRFVENNPSTYGDIASRIGEYSPIAYNLYQGLFGKAEQMKPEDYYNPYENQVMGLMRNRRYNIDPELEANRLATADYYQNLRQGVPSQGRYLSGLQTGQIGRQRADAEVYARKQNMDNAYIGEEAGMLGGLGQQRASTKFQIADINAANRGLQQSYIPTALSQLQQQLQVNRVMREKARLMKNRALRDEERERIMEDYFKGYNFK